MLFRSQGSILKEVRQMAADPEFKGHISDVGGPTANMYQMRCTRPDVEAKCRRLSCVHPTVCKLLGVDHGPTKDLLKQVRGNDLVAAVRQVARGQSLLDPAITTQVLERLRRGNEEDERLAHLTPQERNILELIAEGLTNRQIAERVHLAEKTVKNYVSNLLAKLGMERRTQAAVYAARLAEQRDHPDD